VPTTVDEGIVISQLNMPNLFTTVMADFSDRLYFSLNLQDQLGLVTGTNNRIYVLSTVHRRHRNRLHGLHPARSRRGPTRRSAPTSRRSKRRSRAVWPTWTITPNGAKYRITTDANITLIIPSFSDLTNPDWIRDNWTGPSYNPNATNSANPGFMQDFTTDWQVGR
jgi:hypothetical protein